MNFGFQSGNGGSIPPTISPYGAWYDSTQQVLEYSGVAQAMNLKFNVTQFGFEVNENGFGQRSQITMINATKSYFNLQFSAQLFRLEGGTKESVDIWIRVNNDDVPFSATKLTFANNMDYMVAAWNWYIQLEQGSFVEIMWSSTSRAIVLQSEPSSQSIPAVPSLITTICKVG